MKWAKTENDLNDEKVNKTDPKQMAVFKNYPDEIALRSDLGTNYNQWVTYPIEKKTQYTDDELETLALYPNAQDKLPDLKSKKAQRKYEVFCGGFLFYHDFIVKLKEQNIPADHKIYFEWLPNVAGAKKDSVIIHITKTPIDQNPNPPKPPPPPPPESNP